MLNPREANMPETWARTPGWFCTRADSKWRLRAALSVSGPAPPNAFEPAPTCVDIDESSCSGFSASVTQWGDAGCHHDHLRIYDFRHDQRKGQAVKQRIRPRNRQGTVRGPCTGRTPPERGIPPPWRASDTISSPKDRHSGLDWRQRVGEGGNSSARTGVRRLGFLGPDQGR